MKGFAPVLPIFGLILAVLVSGCTDGGKEVTATQPTTTLSNSVQTTTTVTIRTTTTLVKTIEGLTSISTLDVWASWDADADDDGMKVGINFKDDKGDVIDFRGVELRVDVRLYTSKYDANYNTVKDRLVYEGSATINNAADANLFIGGIRIPKEAITVNNSTDKRFGILEVTVHTPTQGDFSARSELAKLYE